jgi:hypothetical protein
VLELQHVPREGNSVADALSAGASTQASVPEGVFQRRLLKPSAQPAELGEGGRTSTSKLAVPAVHTWSPSRVVCPLEGPEDLREPHPGSQEGPDAWISEVRDYLKDNFLSEDQASAERIVRMAKRYTVVEGDLYRRGANGILMRCITQEEGRDLLAEIRGGECGSHSSSRTLVGKAFRHGFYWPTALQDAAELVRSCKACQFHAKQIHTPDQALQMIPPSWPFAVWGLDILAGTGTFTSPSTNSPSGRKQLQWSTSPRHQQLPSSSQLCASLGSRTASSPTIELSSRANTFKSTVKTLASSSVSPQWRTPGAMAKSSGLMLRSSEGSRSGPIVILRNMAQNGLTSFRACYGGTGPHPAGRLGKPLSSWSTGPKHAFPRRSPWALCESKPLMRTCKNSSVAKTWTSSTSEDGEQQSRTHGTARRYHQQFVRSREIRVGTWY